MFFHILFMSKFVRPLHEQLQLLKVYKACSEGASNTCLEWWYMTSCRVRLLVVGGKLRAAYTVNFGFAPYRYLGLRVMSARERNRRLKEHKLTLKQCVELTGIWFDPSVSRSQRNGLYLLAIIDALLTGRKAIFGGCVIGPVQRKQMRVMHRLFWEGEVDFHTPDGRLEKRTGKVYFCYWYEALPRIIYCLLEDLLAGLPKIKIGPLSHE